MHRLAPLVTVVGFALFVAGLVVSPVPWLALCVAGAVLTLVGVFVLDVSPKGRR